MITFPNSFALWDEAFYDDFNHFSYNDRSIFTKRGEMIYTNKMSDTFWRCFRFKPV